MFENVGNVVEMHHQSVQLDVLACLDRYFFRRGPGIIDIVTAFCMIARNIYCIRAGCRRSEVEPGCIILCKPFAPQHPFLSGNRHGQRTPDHIHRIVDKEQLIFIKGYGVAVVTVEIAKRGLFFSRYTGSLPVIDMKRTGSEEDGHQGTEISEAHGVVDLPAKISTG